MMSCHIVFEARVPGLTTYILGISSSGSFRGLFRRPIMNAIPV